MLSRAKGHVCCRPWWTGLVWRTWSFLTNSQTPRIVGILTPARYKSAASLVLLVTGHETGDSNRGEIVMLAMHGYVHAANKIRIMYHRFRISFVCWSSSTWLLIILSVWWGRFMAQMAALSIGPGGFLLSYHSDGLNSKLLCPTRNYDPHQWSQASGGL